MGQRYFAKTTIESQKDPKLVTNAEEIVEKNFEKSSNIK